MKPAQKRRPGPILLTIVLKSICVGLFFLVPMGCSYLNPFDRNAQNVNVGPSEWRSLVVYFKSGTSAEQVEAFKHEVLSLPGSTERAQGFKEEIGSYSRLTPEQAHGHWAFALTFFNTASDEQRAALKESIRSNELVYKVFENVAPNDISESDVRGDAPPSP